MRKAIPDRWLNYLPIGQRVPSTRFIAFKVPLNKNINETVDEDLRLAPHSLLESVPNLGLIVDLTNTNRYYNPQSFRDQNVEHQKLMIPGHQTPPEELAQRFCNYVTNFLEANPDNDKLIGVHCTHGVNRTGYLICYFMITKMNMLPKLAMQTFAEARGHQIERENYTSSLLQLKMVKKRRHDSNSSQTGRGKSFKEEWPRHHHRIQDEPQNEQREVKSWRQDQNIWQQQQQLQLRQQPQHRQQPQQFNHNHYQQRNHEHEDRRTRWQRPERRWQAIANERPQSFNRKDNYDFSYKRRTDNAQTRQPQYRRGQPNDDHQSNSRNNRNNRNNHYNNTGHNFSRNHNYSNNNYSRSNNYNYNNNNNSYSYNRRQSESGTSYNRFSRFNDNEQ